MPAIADYDQSEEEDDQQASSGGGMGGSGPSAGASGGPRATPQKEAEFVPWSRFVSANEEVSKREAGELQSQVQGSVDRANKGRQDAQSAHAAAVGSNYVQPQKAGPTVFGKVQGAGGSSFGAPQAGAAGFAQQRAQTQALAQSAPQTLPAPTSAKGKAAAQNTADRQAPSLVGSDPNDAMRGAVDPNRINTDLSTGKPVSSAGDIAGAKDLEGQIGADAWSKLVGDTTKATEEANSLGSQGGIQALLGKQGNATAFDAALVGGAGGKGFQDVSKRWGGDQLSEALTGANKSAQGDWSRLMGDVDAAASARDAEIMAASEKAWATPGEAGAGPVAGGPNPEGYGWKPEGYDSYEDFMESLALGAGIHGTGMGLSPVDSVMNKLGEGGLYEGNTVAEEFRKGVAKGDLDNQNRHNALQNIEKMYGPAAAKWLWKWMTDGIWGGLAGKNSGAMYKTLADLIDAAVASGALVRHPSGQVTEAQSSAQNDAAKANNDALTRQIDINTGRTSGVDVTGADGTTRPMTPQQNYLRAIAEQDGWLAEWEAQFLSGVDEPVKPG